MLKEHDAICTETDDDLSYHVFLMFHFDCFTYIDSSTLHTMQNNQKSSMYVIGSHYLNGGMASQLVV